MPVTSAAVPGQGAIPGSDTAVVGGRLAPESRAARSNSCPSRAGPPFSQNIVFHNQAVGGGFVNVGLNYLNPLGPLMIHSTELTSISVGSWPVSRGTSPLAGTAFDTTGFSVGFSAGSLDFPNNLHVATFGT